MNKKGQVYILVAIVLCVALFGVVSIVNKVEQDPMLDDFEEISENYRIESEKFLNSILNNKGEISSEFYTFTYQFTAYTKSKSPGYGLIYAFKLGDNLQVGNYLDKPIKVTNINNELLLGCYNKISADLSFEGISIPAGEQVLGQIQDCVFNEEGFSSNKLIIEIDEVFYSFDVEEEVPEIVIVSRLDKEEQRKVFIKGKVSNVKK